MSEAIVRYNTNSDIETLQRTAKMLAMSGYFDTKGDMAIQIAQMATKILAGAELGYGPFAAVNGIHIIQGKPAIGANLMAAAVKNHPRYDYRVVKMTDDEVSIDFYELVNSKREKLGTSTFTKKDAEAAELLKNATWKKYPRNMAFARAMSNGVRFYTPDVFNGNAVYVPEELGANVDGDGNVIDAEWQDEPTPPPDPASATNIRELEKEAKAAADNLHRRVAANGNAKPPKPAAKTPQKPAAKTPQKPAEPQNAPETVDNPFAPDDTSLERLEKLGVQLYGDTWEAKSSELAGHASTGKANNVRDLTEGEILLLISGIEKRLAAKETQEACG